MKLHSQEFKEEIKLIGKQQDIKIIYDDTILGTDEINSVVASYEGNLLKSVMKQLEIDSNIEIPKGQEFNFRYGLLVNDQYEYLDYGNYIVYSVEKQEDTSSYLITCYDKLLYSMKDYEDMKISYPITVRDYINSICNYLGLTFADATTEFVNYDKTIPNELYLTTDGGDMGYTFRDVLDELAQVTASGICLNRYDQLEIRYPINTDDTIDEEYLKDVNVNFGEKYGPINSVVLSRSGDSDNIYYRDEESILENGICEIKIKDNQIMNFNNRDEFLPDIFNKLSTIKYYINDYTSTGIIYYDFLDKYNVKIGNNIYNCIMFNDEQNITQGLEELVYTEKPEVSETDYTKSDKTDRKINQAYIIVDKQNQQITALTENVGQYDNRIAVVEQTVDNINQKVENTQNFTRERNGIDEVVLEDTVVGQNLILEVKINGNTNIWKYLVPEINLTPEENLVPLGDYITLVCDNSSRNAPSINKKEYKIYISEPLRDKNGIHDTLFIDNTKITVIRKIGVDENKELYVLNQEIIEDIGEITLETLDENTYIYIKEYNNLQYYAKYIIENDYTKIFAKQNDLDEAIVTLNSNIKQSANEIELQVKQKVGNNEIISKINQSPEEIAIEAEKLKLEGYTTINGNFIIDTDGNMVCNDAVVTGGDIKIYGDDIYNPNLQITKNKNTKYPRTAFSDSLLDITGDGVEKLVGINLNYDDTAKSSLNLYAGSTGGSIQLSNSSGNTIFSIFGDNGFMTVNGDVYANDYLHNSLEELKKNIQPYNKNAIEIVKNADLYEFNYKTEDDNRKKHVGFIIGEKYRTPSEILGPNKNSIESYTMSGILWKAIQEQQNIIEELNKRIENLEKERIDE